VSLPRAPLRCTRLGLVSNAWHLSSLWFPVTSSPLVPLQCEYLNLPLGDCPLTLPKSLIPVAIVGSTHFQTALTNFLSLVSYYAAPFSAVLIVEHIVFRRSSGAAYDRSSWMSLRALPTGWAGMLSFAMSFTLTVPSMDQVWFVGPIAKKGTGDIGFEVGFFFYCVTLLHSTLH
jgi:hypothetical protein